MPTRLAARELPDEGPIQAFLAETARRHGVWLVGGSIPLAARDPDKLLNSCLVFDDQGRRVARYDKIHLFGFTKGEERYDEAATIEAGDKVVTFDAPLGPYFAHRPGHLLRPAFPRTVSRHVAPLTCWLCPPPSPKPPAAPIGKSCCGHAPSKTSVIVLAAAQGGQHPTGRMTHGNSMILDPWGDILARMDKGEGVIVAELDPARIAEVRGSLPALTHRKL